MASNSERYLKDIIRLTETGGKLTRALQKEIDPKSTAGTKKTAENEPEPFPDVQSAYQAWYSEALAVLCQLLPERVDDFKSYYAPKANRKDILHSNYTMSDYLRGTTVTRYGGEIVVGPSSSLAPMYQQYNIVAGLQNRFKSTLYDIKTLVHADLLDSELEAADELNRNGFQRGAGAVAGVILEGHLSAVCDRHGVPLKKKSPAISDLNDALKAASTIDVAQWRFIQHLGDIRNKCDHKQITDPTKVEVNELIEGVRKITKTVL